MRRAIVATILILPFGMIEACSDDPAAAPPAVGDAGTIIDRAEGGSSGTADSAAADADRGRLGDGGCLCNDDDDVTLDFCPPSSTCGYLNFFETTRTELQANATSKSPEVVQICPRPSVLVGISAVVGTYEDGSEEQALKKVSIVCGVPRVTATPSSLAIAFTEETRPFEAAPEATTKRCDGPLRGFGGRGKARVDQFVGRCAGVALESTKENELKLSVSGSTDLYFGEFRNQFIFPETDCPSMAVGVRFLQGASVIEAIGLVCGEPDLWWE